MENLKQKFYERWYYEPHFKQKFFGSIALLVIGIFLVLSPTITKHLISSYQPNITKKEIAKNQKTPGEYNYADVKKLSLANVAQARAQAGNIKIIGEIAIPDDHIHIPIAKGITNTTLALSAGTFREDMKMGHGNYALAGHNMANHSPILFSPLYDYAKKGQKIYITDLTNIYTYTIYQRKIINPSDVQVVKNTKQSVYKIIPALGTKDDRKVYYEYQKQSGEQSAFEENALPKEAIWNNGQIEQLV